MQDSGGSNRRMLVQRRSYILSRTGLAGHNTTSHCHRPSALCMTTSDCYLYSTITLYCSVDDVWGFKSRLREQTLSGTGGETIPTKTTRIYPTRIITPSSIKTLSTVLISSNIFSLGGMRVTDVTRIILLRPLFTQMAVYTITRTSLITEVNLWSIQAAHHCQGPWRTQCRQPG
jgi:hypothetical protein